MFGNWVDYVMLLLFLIGSATFTALSLKNYDELVKLRLKGMELSKEEVRYVRWVCNIIETLPEWSKKHPNWKEEVKEHKVIEKLYNVQYKKDLEVSRDIGGEDE